MIVKRVNDVALQAQLENAQEENAKLKAILDYVAMMADVEIPTEDEEEQHE